jgi:hypothetical protein
MPVIGDVTARIGVDDSGLKRGLDSAGKYTASKFKAIGAAAAATFAASFAVNALTEIANMTGQLKTFAMQAGISAEEFQRFNFAIEKAGGDASDTVSIMNDLKRAMADARTGKKDWIDRFALFGITMDQIKKDDPVALFHSLGVAVARTTELTGEQVDALGKMMGEDTSVRAIAAFRDNFVTTLNEINVIADKTIEKIREINAELKKSQMETDRQIAEGIAESGDTITRLAKLWGSIKSGTVGLGVGIGSAIFKASDVITTQAAFGKDGGGAILEGAAIPFGRSKSAREFDRKQEIQAQFQKAQLEVLKQIRDKTGSGASTDAAVMGGL